MYYNNNMDLTTHISSVSYIVQSTYVSDNRRHRSFNQNFTFILPLAPCGHGSSICILDLTIREVFCVD